MSRGAPEYRIRQWALHLALCIRRSGDNKLVLRERYDTNGYRKRVIGTYRTWPAVGRGLDRYMAAELSKLSRREIA